MAKHKKPHKPGVFKGGINLRLVEKKDVAPKKSRKPPRKGGGRK